MGIQAHYDFIIVGAGPVGMLAAIAMANREDTTVCLIDPEKKYKKPKSHPMTIRQSTYEFLCAMNIWPMLEKNSQPLKQINLVNNHNFGSVYFKQKPLGYMIDSAVLVDSLHKVISDHHNIAYRWGSSVKDIKPCYTDWVCSIQEANQGIEDILAKRIIACDGVKSTVCEKLQVESQELKQNLLSTVIEIKTSDWPVGSAWQVVQEGRISGVIPGQNKNSGFVIITSEKHVDNVEQAIKSVCLDRLGDIEAWQACGVMPSYLKSREPIKQAGIIALGNARLALPPIAAQGFNFAVDDIRTLAHWQKRGAWQNMDAKNWQQGWYQQRQPFAEQLYQDMKKILLHMAQKPSILSSCINTAAWSWMGCDAKLQHTMYTKGQGMRSIHE